MMGSVCAEQHKHQLLLSKKALREVDIPPRKLFARRATAAPESVANMFADSPRTAAEEVLLQKFLPCNGGNEDEDDDDPYSSDHFRMYEFKVRRCTRSRSHDWTDCPFAHPGEKARRRDPRRCHYSGAVCPEFRRGSCSRGDNCEFAHGVFECWLHPARYRTEACKDGKNCKRKVCFFAHSPRQLRLVPPSSQTHCNSPPPPQAAERKYRNSNHCCLFCHSAASPTSTLMGMSHLSPPMSPSLSPPVSPPKSRSMSGLSPISRYSDRWASVDSCGLIQFNPDSLTYKDVLTELMTSLESMNVNQASPPSNTNRRNPQWFDVSFNNGDDQQQFVLSPSPPTPSGSRNFQIPGEFSGESSKIDDNKLIDSNLGCPDFGWVNDLLT